MKLVGQPGPFDTNIKRFYVPGLKLEGVCPKCGAPYERSFNDQYLSYPQANAPAVVSCYCGPCSHEWEVPARLNITLELIEPTGALVGDPARQLREEAARLVEGPYYGNRPSTMRWVETGNEDEDADDLAILRVHARLTARPSQG